MSEPALIVLWDGRRQGPGGAYLAVLPETFMPAPPLPPTRGSRATLANRILAELHEHGLQSNRELAARMHKPGDDVNYALQMLYRRNQIEKCRQEPRRGLGPGRPTTIWQACGQED